MCIHYAASMSILIGHRISTEETRAGDSAKMGIGGFTTIDALLFKLERILPRKWGNWIRYEPT